MRSIVLVAACLAYAGHAQHRRGSLDVLDVQTLATLLQASSPRSAFTPSSLGTRVPTRPVAAKRDATVKTPLMVKQHVIDDMQRSSKPLMLDKSISKSDVVLVQGASLKTWSYRTSLVDRVQVVLTTDGRPLDADVQLWQGPDNTPFKMRVYSEDGSTRPFSAVIATPDDSASTVAVYNTGQIEFPLAAYVMANDVDEPLSDFRDTSIIIQGGALRTFDFNTAVESVEVMLKTDGRPLNARIELLQGPNNVKQVIELYGEDGLERPFFAILDTIGTGNVVRVVNTAPLEFPMFASVQPHSVNEQVSVMDPVIGDR